MTVRVRAAARKARPLAGEPATMARRLALSRAAARELTDRIAPFWLSLKDARGGFYGGAWDIRRPLPDMDKAAVAQCRILWFFSKLYAHTAQARYAQAARHAHQFISLHLFDAEQGGIIWSTRPGGARCDGQKHLYAHAFAIFALAAYHQATQAQAPLEQAIGLFRLVETRFSAARGGYCEAFTADWRRRPNDQMGMAEAEHSFNAHLHLLEAYVELWTAWPDEALRGRIDALLDLLLERTYAADARAFRPFFSSDWRSLSVEQSFGHDIEAAWMLAAYAETIASALAARLSQVQRAITQKVLTEGFDAQGGLISGLKGDGSRDRRRIWWVQAEGLTGLASAYAREGQDTHLGAIETLWRFVERRLSDPRGGDWRASPPGWRSWRERRADAWKCPYHNGRACLALIALAPQSRQPANAA